MAIRAPRDRSPQLNVVQDKGTGPNGTKLRLIWDVSGAGFFGGSRGGFEENFLSDEAHFAQNGFQSAMFGNGLLEEFGLVCGEGYTDRPRIDLARPSPVAGVVGRHAAVGDPFQQEDKGTGPLSKENP
jgi:hypothetical protein